MTDINDQAGLNPEIEAGRTSPQTGDLRDRASAAYEDTRETIAGGIDQNPLALVIGGIALGAVVGALLPRTEREGELLGATGRRITDAASGALGAARTAGQDKLDELGINPNNAKQQLNTLFKSVAQAVQEAAGAATQSVKGDAKTSASTAEVLPEVGAGPV